MQALKSAQPNDDSLNWELLRKGHKDGLSALFKEYYSPLFYYGLQLIPDEAFIQDALQDFFLDLWRMRANLSENVALRPYLLSAFRRKVLRQQKQKKRRKKEEQNWTDNYFEALDNEQIPHLLISEDRTNLKKALETLSYQQKEVLFLRYYNGLGFKEVAEVMGLSYQSVRNYAHQAITKLRKYLL